jgi:protein-tyrosine phosphatase
VSGLLADLHCHILPGIDDGAVDEDDAVAMARQAHEDGIALVYATPHLRDDHPVRLDELPDRVAALNARLRTEGVPVEVATGAEVAEDRLATMDADELRRATYDGSGRWLLVEPRPGPLSEALAATVRELTGAGLQPVIAHPERHAGAEFGLRVAQLVADGALVQATAAHILDDGAGPVLLRLAGQGLVHLAGSDAHSSRHGRPVAVRAAVRRLRAAPSDAAHGDPLRELLDNRP